MSEESKTKLNFSLIIVTVALLTLGYFGYIFYQNSKPSSDSIVSKNVPSPEPTNQLHAKLSSCDQLPENYITQVLSSSVNKKEESATPDDSGSSCVVHGSTKNGLNWILLYNVTPTSNSSTIHVDKLTGSLGDYYSYKNGYYRGTLSFITTNNPTKDDQISNDLAMELARSLQVK